MKLSTLHPTPYAVASGLGYAGKQRCLDDASLVPACLHSDAQQLLQPLHCFHLPNVFPNAHPGRKNPTCVCCPTGHGSQSATLHCKAGSTNSTVTTTWPAAGHTCCCRCSCCRSRCRCCGCGCGCWYSCKPCSTDNGSSSCQPFRACQRWCR